MDRMQTLSNLLIRAALARSLVRQGFWACLVMLLAALGHAQGMSVPTSAAAASVVAVAVAPEAGALEASAPEAGAPEAPASDTPASQEAASVEAAPEPPAAMKDDPDNDPLPSLDELLGRGAEDPESYEERCILTRNIRSHRVLDSQHLVFEMRRGERFLVQFPRRCFGLRRGEAISYRSTSSRLCRLDDIRPLEFRGRGLEQGFPCYIPGFQRVSEEQLEYLTATLEARRKSRRR